MFKIINKSDYYLSKINKDEPYWDFSESIDNSISFDLEKDAQEVVDKINPTNCKKEDKRAWIIEV
ncbi:MAG: hypothetical protein KFKLKKLM_02447 [Flavobacteriales bacterium]|nr:hypothetical protein [Flavobacteriales bacterium]